VFASNLYDCFSVLWVNKHLACKYSAAHHQIHKFFAFFFVFLIPIKILSRLNAHKEPSTLTQTASRFNVITLSWVPCTSKILRAPSYYSHLPNGPQRIGLSVGAHIFVEFEWKFSVHFPHWVYSQRPQVQEISAHHPRIEFLTLYSVFGSSLCGTRVVLVPPSHLSDWHFTFCGLLIFVRNLLATFLGPVPGTIKPRLPFGFPFRGKLFWYFRVGRCSKKSLPYSLCALR
jgi:hypothetical protein